MTELWHLCSLLAALAGFLIVAAISLYRGEALFALVIRSFTIFVVLYVVMRYLRALLGLVAGTEKDVEPIDSGEGR